MSADPLHIPLDTKLNVLPSTKQAILETLWGERFTDPTHFLDNERCFAVYLQYYERECRHSSERAPFETHRQLLDAISVLSDERWKPFQELLNDFSTRFLSFSVASTTDQKMGITLCLRLWLMLNIRDREEPYHVAGMTVITLDDTAPVLSALRKMPLSNNFAPPTEEDVLDSNFHILNLKRLADIEIVPTNNLADHLYLHEEAGSRQLHIFCCGYFLSAHLAPTLRTPYCSNIYDEEFLHETRETLKLLFPHTNQDCMGYLTTLQEGSKFDDIRQLPLGSVPLMQPPFVPSNFKFYGKRLSILSKTLNSTKPISFSQLWHDRRNKQTWYTMWIAIVVFLLTLFFGFASIIIGGLQVWLAWPKTS